MRSPLEVPAQGPRSRSSLKVLAQGPLSGLPLKASTQSVPPGGGESGPPTAGVRRARHQGTLRTDVCGAEAPRIHATGNERAAPRGERVFSRSRVPRLASEHATREQERQRGRHQERGQRVLMWRHAAARLQSHAFGLERGSGQTEPALTLPHWDTSGHPLALARRRVLSNLRAFKRHAKAIRRPREALQGRPACTDQSMGSHSPAN